jgi:hypothetical protein
MIAHVPFIAHYILEDNVVIVPPKLNTQTIVQGVPFHVGFHPPATNLADSPLQAYNDNMCDSGSDHMVQYMFLNQDSVYEANAFVLARLYVAKAAISAYLLPNISLDNAHFLKASIKFGK